MKQKSSDERRGKRDAEASRKWKPHRSSSDSAVAKQRVGVWWSAQADSRLQDPGASATRRQRFGERSRKPSKPAKHAEQASSPATCIARGCV